MAMKRVIVAAALGLAACGGGSGDQSAPRGNPPGTPGEAITLRAPDGLTIFGRLYRSAKPKALILLFHQARSGKGEYATIAPRLSAMGYDALAIDARAGGDLYGDNETVLLKGGSQPYLDAKQDLQAAIDWGKARRLPIILWGSSYSSSLVFPLAVENASAVKGVLAFSPGEYFDDTTLIARAARHVTVPVFVTMAPTAEEQARAKPIFDAVAARDKTWFVPAAGVHGSSTLIAAKNPDGAASEWGAVTAFLKKLSA